MIKTGSNEFGWAAEYPDLLHQMETELRSSGKCSKCQKNAMIRKYNAKYAKRKLEDARAARIIKHKGAK